MANNGGGRLGMGGSRSSKGRSGHFLRSWLYRCNAFCLGFETWGGQSTTWDLGSRVSGFGFRVSGFGFQVSDLGFRISGFGFCVKCSVCRVRGFLLRVKDEGLGYQQPHRIETRSRALRLASIWHSVLPTAIYSVEYERFVGSKSRA